jgi:HlyD family secretion protein
MKRFYTGYTLYNIGLLVILSLLLSGCWQQKEEKGKFYGNVDVRTVMMSFRVSGKIEAVYADEGQKVKKGEVLAVLDKRLYQEYVNQTNANIKAQEANLLKLKNGYEPEEIDKAKALMEQKRIAMENAQTFFKRQEKLFNAKSVAKQTYDDALAAYEQAQAGFIYAKSNYAQLQKGFRQEDILALEAQIDSLKAVRNQQLLNLEDTELKAPSDAVVLSRFYEEGSIIQASVPVYELAKTQNYWVRCYMSEQYLGKIKVGMKARIYTDSNPDTAYNGTVSFISPLAEFTPKSVQTEDLRTDLVYRFRIIVDSKANKRENKNDGLRQGMPVTVKFDNVF